MLRVSNPILRVSSAAAAEEFYCKRLGFRREFAYRPHPSREDPSYLGLVRDGAHLHLSSFSGDGPFGVRVQILVDDVDGLLSEFRQAGLTLGDPLDQTWGKREVAVEDADGNILIFAQEAG